MNKYKCCLKMEIDDPEWVEIDDFDPSGAAEEYADKIFNGKSMWELQGDWEGDYSIIVEDSDGNRFNFNITVEMVPSFSASKIQGGK